MSKIGKILLACVFGFLGVIATAFQLGLQLSAAASLCDHIKSRTTVSASVAIENAGITLQVERFSPDDFRLIIKRTSADLPQDTVLLKSSWKHTPSLKTVISGDSIYLYDGEGLVSHVSSNSFAVMHIKKIGNKEWTDSSCIKKASPLLHHLQ